MRPCLVSTRFVFPEPRGGGQPPGIQLLLLLLACLVPSPAHAQKLEAIRLEKNGDHIKLEGQARLQLGACRISANELRLNLANGVVEGDQVRLCGARGELAAAVQAHRMRLGRGGALEGTLVRGTPCACTTKRRPLLSFTASSARVRPGGARLHLSWPVLRVGRVPVAALPYLALPLERNVSGLVTPEVGYSGRDGVRLAQGVYLVPVDQVDLLLAAGWIQRRGVQGRARLRARAGRWGSLSLEGRGVRDEGWNRGELRGRAVARGQRWGIGVSPNLTSDVGLPALLHQEVERVFAPYLRSRAWARGGWRSLYLEGTGDLFQRLYLGVESSSVAAGSVELGIAPTQIGPLQVTLESGVDRWGDVSGAGLTWIRLDPTVGLDAGLGPLRIAAWTGYRLRVSQSEEVGAAHAGIFAADAALPLARRFGSRWIHIVEPTAGVEWSMLESDLATPDGVRIRAGGQAHLGLLSEIWSRLPGRPVPFLGLWTGAVVPFLTGQEDLLLAGRLELGFEHLRARAAVSWVPWTRLAALRLRLCTKLRVGPGQLRACGGYWRVRVVRVGELVQDWPRRPQPGTLLPLPLSPDQLFASGALAIGVVQLRGAMAWDPMARRHSYSSFGASAGLGCGCYRVGLAGATRAGQRYPDLLLTLEMSGAAAGVLRCWP